MTRVFKGKRSYGALGLILFLAAAAAVVILVLSLLASLDSSQREEDIKLGREALVRAAVQCYSLEGRYPPNLEYLEENYGLTLDRNKYVYHYQTMGENIMPSINLFPTGA